MRAWYIGLMSGTSVDGIDAVLVDLSVDWPHTPADWDSSLRQDILHTLEHPEQISVDALGRLGAVYPV